MSKIDEQKEYIGALKVYLGFVLATLISVGAGISRLYLSEHTGIVFWLGGLIFTSSIIIFILIAKKMHRKIEELKDL